MLHLLDAKPLLAAQGLMGQGHVCPAVAGAEARFRRLGCNKPASLRACARACSLIHAVHLHMLVALPCRLHALSKRRLRRHCAKAGPSSDTCLAEVDGL